jgi:hypothetical protein
VAPQKQKQSKKQKADCRLGDLVKTKTRKDAP